MDEDQKIIAKQMEIQARAIAWMARTLADVFETKARIIASSSGAKMLASDVIGERDFGIMDQLGDILNGLDAAQDVPVFVDQAFEHGREMFPQKNEGSEGPHHGMD